MSPADFVGRTEELRLLERCFRLRESAFVPIYGRRRVGKSELILRFLRHKPGIYHVGKRAKPGLLVREMLEGAADALHEPLLAGLSTDDWKTALDAIVGRWRGPGKLVLVFDEFQWTAAASAELPSIIQELWDRSWKKSGRIMLILCGSFIGFMEREVLGRQSPLFGRRTAQILLRPFGYREAAGFHPSYAHIDHARTYFVCGGIPLYLKYFSPERSVEMNIADNLLSEFGPLYREPDFLLREELREVETYYTVLMALAAGAATNRDISAGSDIGERSLHYYLQQLTELGYLARRYPLDGRKPVKRRVHYTISDPLLRFWFRFVFPHTSSILHSGPRRSFESRIRPSLDAYFGVCFESLCREAMPALYDREGVTAAFEVGEYWDSATQIDVVGLRDDGWVDVGECRWGTVRSPAGLAAELEERIRRYPNPRGATIGGRVFTRQPAKPVGTARRVQWHGLDDLYAL